MCKTGAGVIICTIIPLTREACYVIIRAVLGHGVLRRHGIVVMTMIKSGLAAVFCAVLAALSLTAAGEVAWLWDDSARIAPTTSTVVRATSFFVAKGGGSGRSLQYGSEQEPFESRCTSTRSISGFVLSSKPPAAMAIIFR